jgi:hypothetical protein
VLQRAVLATSALRERRDVAEAGLHAGRGRDRLGGAPGHERAGEDLPLGLDRPRLARERRLVDAQIRRRHKVGVGGDAVAGLEQQHVAGHHVLADDLHRVAVAAHVGVAGQHPPQRCDRPLGAVPLGEREDRVDRDDRGDRDGQLRHAGQQRQPGARPQQERERLHEAGRELARIETAPSPR